MLDYLAAWDYMVTDLGFEPQVSFGKAKES